MKTRFVLSLLALSLLAGCERSSPPISAEEDRRRAEEVRALDDRIARVQEIEDRLAAREAEQTEAEREQLLRDKEQLEAERDALAASRNAADAKASRAEREAREAAKRAEQAAELAKNERADAQLDFFYNALDAHGEWLEVDGLGFCWQPRVAEKRGWRPYTDGRWVFTEYGWTWKSNEPFGWATYHYGRWTRLQRIGWIWVPATEWGPAWVSWRRSDEFIGWAPLPPDAWSASGFTAAVDSYYDIGPGAYNFVPVETLGAETYLGQVVAPEQNVTIVNKTVNITNVTYKTVNNVNVVYNAGPELQRANRSSREKIPQLRVERVAEVRGESRAASQEGGVLRMVAPRFVQRTEQSAPPKRVRERVKGETPDRGWSGISDRNVVEQVRDRNRREAREVESEQRTGRRAEAPAAAPTTPAAVIPKATPRAPLQDESERPRAAKPAPSTPIAPPAATPRERPTARDTREESRGATPAEAQPSTAEDEAKPTNPAEVRRGERNRQNPGDAGRPGRKRREGERPGQSEQPGTATPPAVLGIETPSRMKRSASESRPVEAAPEPATVPDEGKSVTPAGEAKDKPQTEAEQRAPADVSKVEPDAPTQLNDGIRRKEDRPIADQQPVPEAPAAGETLPPAALEQSSPGSVPETVPASDAPAATDPVAPESSDAAADSNAGKPERRRPRAERERPGNREQQGRAAEREEGRR